MVLLALKVPATLARWVALWLILAGFGLFGASVARAETASDAARVEHDVRERTAKRDAAPSASAASAKRDPSSSASASPEPPAPPAAETDEAHAHDADGSPSGAAAPAASTAPPAASAIPPSASAPLPLPAPLPSAASSGHAGPVGSATPPVGGETVRLHDRAIFTIKGPLGGQTADARARSASQTLERLVEEHETPVVRTEEHADRIVIFGGTTPIVQLGAEDATAAGDESLAVHAAEVAAKVREALQSERQRKTIAETVFSVSLFAFSALVALLLLGKVRELAGKLQSWMEKNPDRLPALRFQGIDLIRPAALRGGLSVALSAGRVLSQIGIAYGWILFASSLFESTRTYTERLTGFVLTPLSALIGRVGSALPLLVILAAAVLATWLLVRFVGLFFGSVARGETTLGGLPRDLAGPTGALVRFGIVVVALLVAAPLLTGNDDGALARTGVATLVALGFASAPVIASIVAGIPAIYGRRVRIGDHVEMGGRAGRVVSVSLLEVRLEDDLGCIIRVPHLTSLLAPTRVVGALPLAIVDLVADPTAPQSHVRSVLLEEARRFGGNVKVELLRLDADGAHYRVAARAPVAENGDDLATALAAALAREEVALGRSAIRRP